MRIAQHDLAQRAFIIAEVGINHGGDSGLAHRLIEAAKDAGADACKFQMFRTNAVVRRRGPTAGFLAQYEFPMRTWESLAGHCRAIGIEFLASVFDENSAEDYFTLHPVAVKIGSGELHDSALLRFLGAAQPRRPLILSTGMATLPEVKGALEHLGLDQVALLHCVSAYPAPTSEVNLRAMDALRAFHVPVGYSDHTLSHAVCLAAVARGACIIEQHLTLDKSMAGPDHLASAAPRDFATLVSGIRQLETVLGDGVKRVMPSEQATRDYCRSGNIADRRYKERACIECAEPLPAGSPTNRRYCLDCRSQRDREADRRYEGARKPRTR